MPTISSIVDLVLKKYSSEIPKLKESLSSNLEFRLFFNIDLSKPFKEAKKEFLKNYINDILTLSLGNISLAAKKANIHRRHFHRIIIELEVDPEFHKREMLKPDEYMKTYVQNILEETLASFREESKNSKVYSNLDDISVVIAQNIDSLSYDDALEIFEKEYIQRALKDNGYDIHRTAQAIGMNERTLYRKINKLRITGV
ncbi:MAG: helix-turn-helix domain-containing protein [archaeon]